MSKKVGSSIRRIGRNWFTFLIIFIIILFFYNQQWAIWTTVLSILIIVSTYIPFLSFKNRIVKFMQAHEIILDTSIAKKLNKPVGLIRKTMYSLSKNQKRKKWLIIYLENNFIYYNKDIVRYFKQLYKKGYGEKEILQELGKIVDIKTRAEVKAIENTLAEQKRLKIRKTSPQSYREIHKFM